MFALTIFKFKLNYKENHLRKLLSDKHKTRSFHINLLANIILKETNASRYFKTAIKDYQHFIILPLPIYRYFILVTKSP